MSTQTAASLALEHVQEDFRVFLESLLCSTRPLIKKLTLITTLKTQHSQVGLDGEQDLLPRYPSCL